VLIAGMRAGSALADSGEIMVKSPGLLKGARRTRAATAEVLTADG
jgi:long-subunit acyl-CoA synthetase (AMP-forming)